MYMGVVCCMKDIGSLEYGVEREQLGSGTWEPC